MFVDTTLCSITEYMWHQASSLNAQCEAPGVLIQVPVSCHEDDSLPEEGPVCVQAAQRATSCSSADTKLNGAIQHWGHVSPLQR